MRKLLYDTRKHKQQTPGQRNIFVFCFSEAGSCYIAWSDLKLSVLLPQPPSARMPRESYDIYDRKRLISLMHKTVPANREETFNLKKSKRYEHVTHKKYKWLINQRRSPDSLCI
jgi:hypothetical protein